jgi:hypothetical protein
VLAHALDGRAAAIIAPDTVSEVLALGSELSEAAERSRDSERIVAGHLWQIMARLQLGDVARAEVDLATASRIAHALGLPARLWEVCGVHAMLALAAGRLAEADELIREAHVLGERAHPEGAIPSTVSSGTRSTTSSDGSRKSRRRSATWSSSTRPALSFAARSLVCMHVSDGCRRQGNRSSNWRGTTSRPCPSIKSGSMA